MLFCICVMLLPLAALAAVGPDGEVPSHAALASTVMYWFGFPFGFQTTGLDVIVPPPDVTVAVIVPAVITIRTFWEADGGAFWCGFHSDGTNQAVNWVELVQAGLK